MKISDRFKQIREYFHLSQPQAAEKFDILLATWKKYEKGPSEPGSGALKGLAKGGVNINWLVTGNGPMLLSELTQAKQDKAPVPNSPIDYVLLRDLIEMLERALDTRNLMLEPPRKAATIQIMYEYCKLDKETTVPEMVDRILKLVA